MCVGFGFTAMKYFQNRDDVPMAEACGPVLEEANTVRPKINSNDFGVLGINWKIRIRISSSRKIFFAGFEFLVCSITHLVALHVLVLFAPTQFHFECCGVRDDS